MRLILVNHCHPDTPHICATRLREFARILAQRGHHVVLLTSPLSGDEAAAPPDAAARAITDHNWQTPFVLACPAARGALDIPHLKSGHRQLVIAWRYLRNGGLLNEWREGAQPYLRMLAQTFQPDLVWGSLGNTDCWAIARDLATIAACPWIADIKDFWSGFIPPPLRRLVALRYRDAAAWTALSHSHAEDARRWFPIQPTLIYSGFAKDSVRSPGGDTTDDLVVQLTGSVYGGADLGALFAGIRAWVASCPDDLRQHLRFVYRGNDRAVIEAAAAQMPLGCATDISDFIPVSELQSLQRHAMVNLYVKFDRTFHHKLFEFLAARRPILSYPADNAEAAELAARAGLVLYKCTTPTEVVRALDDALLRYRQPEQADADQAALAFSWEAQTSKLETLFTTIRQSGSA